MILILASELDLAARRAASQWPAGPARLVTVADLSADGWSIELGRLSEAVVVSAGEPIRLDSVRGWVNVLTAVHPDELVRVEPADRGFAASEMTAFLTYLLTNVSQPVVNRPSATQLIGPGWSHEKWLGEAARAGLPVRPWSVQSHEDAAFSPQVPVHFVTVVGTGTASAGEAATWQPAAVRLATAARAGFLRVHFGRDEHGLYFKAADPVPPLDEPPVREALAKFFHAP